MVGLSARDARDDIEAFKTRLSPLLGHLSRYHEAFDDMTRGELGPLLDFCLFSWVPEVSDRVRQYKLFGCRLAGGRSS